MKFKTRILLLPGITLALFVAGWLAGETIASRTATTVAALGSVDYPYLEGVNHLDELSQRTTQTIQGAVAEGDKGKLDDVRGIAGQATTVIRGLLALDGHKDTARDLGHAYDGYVEHALDAAHAMLDSNGDVAAKVTAMQTAQKQLTTLLARETAAARKGVQQQLDASRAGVHRMVTANTVSGVAIVLALLLGAWFVLRAISRDLGAEPEQLRRIVERIAAGDLEHGDGSVANPNSVLGKLHGMTRQLGDIVGAIRHVAQNVDEASAQITQGNDDLAHRSQSQAAALEQTAAAMEQMTTSVRQNADSATFADKLAREAREQAEQGGQVVTEANAAMRAIDASSKRIADIVGLIDEIAFQTNLLALNAAVEAARAGDHGRGFAVVASEVRNLAQRSAAAAREIKTLIDDSVDKVGVGSTLVARSGETLASIITSVKKVTDSVAEIATASHEQASGIDEVRRTVTAMDETTQRNAILVKQVSATSRAMQEQAGTLMERVAFFSVADDAPDDDSPQLQTLRASELSPPAEPANNGAESDERAAA